MSIRFHTLLLACLLLSGGLGRRANAQGLVVQQPVIETFAIGTSVVVPDRGSTFLGGVSRAADARTTAGFLPWGSSIGNERSHSSARVHVYIHDLEAMDQALLNAGRPQTEADFQPANPLAERAYLSLMKRDTRRMNLARRQAWQRTEQARPHIPESRAASRFSSELTTRSIRRAGVLK